MSARYTGGLVYNAPGGWSGQFSGTNYLTVPSGASVSGTGDFTIECWIFLPALSATYQNLLIPSAASNAVYIDFNNSIIDIGRNNVGADLAASYALPTNTWFHLAFCRASSTMRIFVNGNQVGSGTVTTNYTASGFNIAHSSNGVNGYISNFRVVQGTAVYTSAFTPPTGALLPITNTSLLTCRYPTFVDGSNNTYSITNTGSVAVNTLNPFPTSVLPDPALGGAGNGVYTMSQYAALKAANLWPAYDPFYRNVTLNLHGDGTNAAQNNTFLDSSTNNFTITRNGNTTQGTFTPYGNNWSNYFTGANSLSFATNAAFSLNSSAFTIEAWVFLDSISGARAVTSTYGGATGWSLQFNSGILTFYRAGDTVAITATTTISAGVWYHIAVSGTAGTSMKLFINGVQEGSTSTGNITDSSTALSVGQLANTNYLAGYVSNLRILKGTALYTSNFIPPTSPLTAITNTSLLTCQSNRFIDSSANAFTCSLNGSPSVQRFSQFSPTTAYSTSVIGGSGYFDGNGDYLSFSGGTPNTIGTSSATIEFWMYATANDGYRRIVASTNGGFATGDFIIRFSNGGFFAGDISNPIVATLPTTNQWYHVAWVGAGGTSQTLYFNGVSVGTATSYNLTNPLLYIGGYYTVTGEYFAGYLSNVRVVKGTAVYTSAFTPPTAPLTAITNTSLLLSYTNSGILDNAMISDLETVGNAQISTSVKKYGTGSMYFDGTGDWLRSYSNPAVPSGTENFTIECWIYLNNLSSTKGLFYGANANTLGFRVGQGYLGNVNGLNICRNQVTDVEYCAYTFAVSTWYHVAVVRSGTTIYFFVNGIQQTTLGSGGGSYSFAVPTSGYYLGCNDATTEPFAGYIDDFRVTRGVARYTTNFTPPTSQVQDQ